MLPANFIVFKSNRANYVAPEDYRQVIAKDPIAQGDLLLMEHVFITQHPHEIMNVIKHSPVLFNCLFPRINGSWNEEQEKEGEEAHARFMETVEEKCYKNMFGVSENGFIIGGAIAHFNHSSNPNAVIQHIRIQLFKDTYICIAYVLATRPIQEGEEIFVWYGEKYFEFDNEPVPVHYITPTTELPALIYPIVRQYLVKPECLAVVMNHICTHYGVYTTLDNNLQITTRANEYFAAFNPPMEVTTDNVVKWMCKISEKIQAQLKMAQSKL